MRSGIWRSRSSRRFRRRSSVRSAIDDDKYLRASNNGLQILTHAPSSERNPWSFFLLVLALAVPIWALGRFVTVIELLKVPITDLILGFIPLIAASLLVFRAEGAGGLVAFLKGAFAYRRLMRSKWFAIALLLAPFIYALTFISLRLAGHSGTPSVSFPGILVLAAIMFVLAIGEEAGWTGYALDPLQARFGALGASLIIAIPWWLGHIPSILAIGGTVSDIMWWLPGAIALRVLMTWLYNSAGRSLSAVILLHMMLNVGRSVFYPTIGTHYDPLYQFTGYAITGVIAALVVIVCGAKTLTKAAPPPHAL